MLLDAGRVDDAYARYAIQATSANTNIAIAKRYPGIKPSRILGDLIASTPGEEGKWFATVKTLKQYDLTLALARRSPVDPKTPVRAARDHLDLAALYWMARGEGYELTGVDVAAAGEHAMVAATALGVEGGLVRERIAANVVGDGPAARWGRQCLGFGRESMTATVRIEGRRVGCPACSLNDSSSSSSKSFSLKVTMALARHRAADEGRAAYAWARDLRGACAAKTWLCPIQARRGRPRPGAFRTRRRTRIGSPC